MNEEAGLYKEVQTEFSNRLDAIFAGREEFIYWTFSDKYGELMDYCVLEDGDAYFLYQRKWEAADGKYEHFVLKYTKETDSYAAVGLDIEADYMERILASAQGTIVLMGSNTLWLYNPNEAADGKEIPFYVQLRADSRMGAFFSNDNSLVCMPALGESYEIYDLESGKKKGVYLDKKYLYGKVSGSLPFIQKAGEDILLLTGEGIFERREKGWELQVSSERNSMCRSDFSPEGVWKGEQEDYYVKTGTKLYHYLKDGDKQEATVTLHIRSGEEIKYMRDIIVSYELEHPEVDVEYDYLVQELPGDIQEYNTLIQRANAEIVSKSAADIYILDDLPWREYQKKGYLYPLDELVEKIILEEDCYKNIIDGCRSQGGLFIIPAYFDGNLFICRDTLENSVQDIRAVSAYLQENPDAQGMVPYTCAGNIEYFVGQIYRSYGQQLCKEDEIDEESIRSYLTAVKNIYDRTIWFETSEKTALHPKYDISAYCLLEDIWRMGAYNEGSVSTGPFTSLDYSNLYMATKMEGCSVSLNEYFIPRLIYGIHSQTAQRAASEEFLRYAFHYIHEKQPSLVHIPVFRDGMSDRVQLGFERLHEKYKTEENFYTSTIGREEEPFLIHMPTVDEYDAIYVPWIERLKYIGQEPVMSDPVYAIYASPAISLLRGDCSIDQAVEEIAAGMRLWW